MKKVFFLFVLTSLAAVGFSQSIKKAQKAFSKGDYAGTKEQVDGLLEKNPNDMDAVYLKSKLYAKIADSAALHSLVSGDARAAAFDAFKKAVADSGNAKLKLEIMKDNYGPVFEMYQGYYQDAVNDFNKAAQSQSADDFKNAMDNFIHADEVGHYIAQNQWAQIGLVDTTLVLNIGKAAINAKQEPIAIKYFTELADAKITGPAGQNDEGFKLPYEWLEQHYKNAGDVDNMKKYADLGNELYPKETFFNFLQMDYYRGKRDMLSLLKLYPHIIDEHPDSVRYRFSYANDIFGYIYNADDGVQIPDKDQWLSTINEQLEKARAIDPNDINTNWLTAQYYYNLGIEERDNSIKATDKDQKDKLKSEAMDNWNRAIPYADKAISALASSGNKDNKSRYKSVVNLMQNIYQSMGDKDNLKKYQDMYDGADAKFGE